MKPTSILFALATMCSIFLSSCAQQHVETKHDDILVKDIDTTVSPAKDFFHYANGA